MSENHKTSPVAAEEGVEVPYERIDADTLRKLIEEFVTREWSSLADDGYSLGDKVERVLEQLKSGKVRVVCDLNSGTVNLAAVK
jgi:uncharacterized protein YheU (UPF0270 family)